MEINCTTCGARIPAEDMNLDRMVAKCRICNTVFGIGEQLSAEGAAPRHRRRPFVGLPERMTILADDRALANPGDYRHVPGKGGDLVIRRRWFQPAKHLTMLFFCVFWDGFLAFWYSTLLTVDEKGGGPGLVFYLFPLLHVSVGIGLTYSAIAGLFNTTLVGIRGEDFFVRHGPIPWRGNRTLPARTITQLFCEEKVSRSKDGDMRTYNLSAILEGGQRVALVTGLPTVDQALFLEQTLEERLEIVDVEVGGEIAG